MEIFAKGGYASICVGCFEPLSLRDVDDYIVNGKLDAKGWDIVDTFDSYTELSPSGNGMLSKNEYKVILQEILQVQENITKWTFQVSGVRKYP